jgi:hypothetical protein
MKIKHPFRRRKPQLNVEAFTEQWQMLQKMCANRKTWPQAIIEADDLLDAALRKRRYKGKTTGERLVAAQHDLSGNDTVWFSHKYRKQMDDIDVRTLKKKDVAAALTGFRQALRDLGALERND